MSHCQKFLQMLIFPRNWVLVSPIMGFQKVGFISTICSFLAPSMTPSTLYSDVQLAQNLTQTLGKSLCLYPATFSLVGPDHPKSACGCLIWCLMKMDMTLLLGQRTHFSLFSPSHTHTHWLGMWSVLGSKMQEDRQSFSYIVNVRLAWTVWETLSRNNRNKAQQVTFISDDFELTQVCTVGVLHIIKTVFFLQG